jgi:hypothetical protein
MRPCKGVVGKQPPNRSASEVQQEERSLGNYQPLRVNLRRTLTTLTRGPHHRAVEPCLQYPLDLTSGRGLSVAEEFIRLDAECIG